MVGCVSNSTQVKLTEDNQYPLLVGPVATSNFTPAHRSLACLREQLTNHQDREPIYIAVGKILDLTGKLGATESGAVVTQGASLMMISALGKLGDKIKLAERFDISVANQEFEYISKRYLGDGRSHLIRDESGDRRVTWMPYLGGSIRKSNYYITGGITEINYNIFSGGGEVRIRGVGPKQRVFVMNVGTDLRIVKTSTLEVVKTVSLQKQLVGYDQGLDIFRFFGSTLFEINTGSKVHEPMQLAIRALMELGAVELVSAVASVFPDDCLKLANWEREDSDLPITEAKAIVTPTEQSSPEAVTEAEAATPTAQPSPEVVAEAEEAVTPATQPSPEAVAEAATPTAQPSPEAIAEAPDTSQQPCLQVAVFDSRERAERLRMEMLALKLEPVRIVKIATAKGEKYLVQIFPLESAAAAAPIIDKLVTLGIKDAYVEPRPRKADPGEQSGGVRPSPEAVAEAEAVTKASCPIGIPDDISPEAVAETEKAATPTAQPSPEAVAETEKAATPATQPSPEAVVEAEKAATPATQPSPEAVAETEKAATPATQPSPEAVVEAEKAATPTAQPSFEMAAEAPDTSQQPYLQVAIFDSRERAERLRMEMLALKLEPVRIVRIVTAKGEKYLVQIFPLESAAAAAPIIDKLVTLGIKDAYVEPRPRKADPGEQASAAEQSGGVQPSPEAVAEAEEAATPAAQPSFEVAAEAPDTSQQPYLQVAIFDSRERAERLRMEMLALKLEPVRIVRIVTAKGEKYLVQIFPLESAAAAASIIDKLVTLGIKDAYVEPRPRKADPGEQASAAEQSGGIQPSPEAVAEAEEAATPAAQPSFEMAAEAPDTSQQPYLQVAIFDSRERAERLRMEMLALKLEPVRIVRIVTAKGEKYLVQIFPLESAAAAAPIIDKLVTLGIKDAYVEPRPRKADPGEQASAAEQSGGIQPSPEAVAEAEEAATPAAQPSFEMAAEAPDTSQQPYLQVAIFDSRERAERLRMEMLALKLEPVRIVRIVTAKGEKYLVQIFPLESAAAAAPIIDKLVTLGIKDAYVEPRPRKADPGEQASAAEQSGGIQPSPEAVAEAEEAATPAAQPSFEMAAEAPDTSQQPYLQVAIFDSRERAERLRMEMLALKLEPVRIVRIVTAKGEKYLVQIFPLESAAAAASIIDKLVTLGIKDAYVEPRPRKADPGEQASAAEQSDGVQPSPEAVAEAEDAATPAAQPSFEMAAEAPDTSQQPYLQVAIFDSQERAERLRMEMLALKLEPVRIVRIVTAKGEKYLVQIFPLESAAAAAPIIDKLVTLGIKDAYVEPRSRKADPGEQASAAEQSGDVQPSPDEAVVEAEEAATPAAQPSFEMAAEAPDTSQQPYLQVAIFDSRERAERLRMEMLALKLEPVRIVRIVTAKGEKYLVQIFPLESAAAAAPIIDKLVTLGIKDAYVEPRPRKADPGEQASAAEQSGGVQPSPEAVVEAEEAATPAAQPSFEMAAEAPDTSQQPYLQVAIFDSRERAERLRMEMLALKLEPVRIVRIVTAKGEKYLVQIFPLESAAAAAPIIDKLVTLGIKDAYVEPRPRKADPGEQASAAEQSGDVQPSPDEAVVEAEEAATPAAQPSFEMAAEAPDTSQQPYLQVAIFDSRERAERLRMEMLALKLEPVRIVRIVTAKGEKYLVQIFPLESAAAAAPIIDKLVTLGIKDAYVEPRSRKADPGEQASAAEQSGDVQPSPEAVAEAEDAATPAAQPSFEMAAEAPDTSQQPYLQVAIFDSRERAERLRMEMLALKLEPVRIVRIVTAKGEKYLVQIFPLESAAAAAPIIDKLVTLGIKDAYVEPRPRKADPGEQASAAEQSGGVQPSPEAVAEAEEAATPAAQPSFEMAAEAPDTSQQPYLQVAIFDSRERAERLRMEMLALKLEPVRIVRIVTAKGEKYLVQIFPLESAAAAAPIIDKLVTLGIKDAYVEPRPRKADPGEQASAAEQSGGIQPSPEAVAEAEEAATPAAQPSFEMAAEAPDTSQQPYLQVAIFDSRERAERLRMEMLALKLEPVRIVRIVTAKGEKYLVQIFPLESAAAAAPIIDKLVTLGIKDAYVEPRPRKADPGEQASAAEQSGDVQPSPDEAVVEAEEAATPAAQPSFEMAAEAPDTSQQPYLQVAIFDSRERAERLRMEMLALKLEPVRIVRIVTAKGEKYLVQIFPLESAAAAAPIIDKLVTLGIKDAYVEPRPRKADPGEQASAAEQADGV